MSGTRLAYYVAGGALSLGAPAYTAKAQSACPTVISGTPLSSPIIVPDGTPAASIDLAINRDILVSSGAVVTSSLAALAVPDQAGAYAIDAAGGNAIIVCGTVGLGPDPFTLPGGGIRAGSGSRVLVTDGGTIFGSRNGPATAPAIELLGPGSGITVDAGGQILGGFAPAVRADAPVAITNNGTIAVTGGEGFETAAIDLTGGVGSIITNTGTISSTSFPAIRFRDARGVAGGVTQIINSGRISGGTRFPGGNDGIELRRGLTSIINSGTIDIITVGTAADSDGFNPASGLTLINQAGYIGPIIITPPNPGFSPDLAYDLTLTNAAGATIGSVPGVRFNTSLPLGTSFVGVTHQEAGQLRITNAGVIEGLYNGVRFASGDTVITNAAGASIRTPDENLSFPAANEGYAIYGNPTINIGAARPLIDNGGTIFGLFGGVNTGTVDATVINRSVRDSSGIVIGGGSIGGGASGVTIGGGSIINEAGATIFSAAVRAPGDAGCITRRESFGVTCTSLLNTIFFTNPAMVGSLDNSGTITSRSRQTLLSFSPLALHNRSTGLIESLGASGPAIDAVSGLAADFVNEGVIRASGTVVQITGTSGASFGHDIINRGAITGVNGGTALITNGSSARFVNELGAVVSGGVVLQGVQNIPNGAGTSPTSGSVLNSGTINGALLFGTGGDLVNQSTGSIVATSTSSAAVSSALSNNAVNSFLNVTNGGFISGVARAIQSVGSRVRVNITNLTGGSIISTDSSNVFGRGNGIDVGGTLSLVNQIGAQIIGSPGSSGVVAAQATDFFNAGTISGGAFGVQISDFLAAPSGEIIFRNSGTITGTALSGVQTFISGNIRFENSGLISGGSAGLTVTGSPARSVAISSSGSITSSLGHGVNLAGGSLTGFENSGSIVAAQNGLNLRNIANAAIINQTGGLIDTRSSGNGWAGIAVFGGSGTIVNQAGATISASAGTNEGGESAIFIGANAGLVRVENDGVLSGVLTFYGENATDLVNRGSILATQVSDGDAVNILLGGVFRNEAGASVTATRDAIYVFDNDDNGTITDIHNAAGAVITGDSDGDGIGLAISADDSNQAVSGVERVFNAGTIMGGISLGLNDDRLDLTTTGTISGASSGGAGVDSLRIDTTTGATRTLAEGQFAAFEDIVLNPTAGAAGRYVVTAAGDPLTTATLDAGLVGSSITLAQGELSLRDTASSVRAETVSTAAGTLLSGNGIVFGDTSVAGTIAPGNSVGHLTVEGDLTLAPTALLTFELGQANVVGGQFNDLITVNGSLVLDGLLTVAQSAGGNFAPGVYRLIDYQGGLAALTDNGLGIGNVLPNGLNGTIQTSIANQVNLVIAGAAVDISYWDGANFSANGLIDGGTGVWNSSNTNFTLADGSANAPWDNDIGVFAGPAGGTVTVEGVQGFAGLQFVTDGYRIVRGTTDAGLTLGSGGFIFVDQAVDTRFDLAVTGSGTLVKQGEGRLILSDASSYAGGTSLNGGTLSVANDLALGVGGIRLTSGTTLQSNALGLRLNNDLTVLGSGSAVATVDTQTFDLTLAGQLAGDGRLAKTGSGALLVATGGRLAGVTVSGGSFDLVGAATLDLATSLTLADSTRLTLAQGTLLNAGTLGIVGDGGRQTIVSSGTINGPVALGGGADAIDLSGTISSGIDLGAGDDAFILRSNGSVGQSVNGGAGNDRLTFELAVGATRAIDGGAFTGFEDIEKGAGGTLRIATSVLTGQTLRVDPGSLEVASGAGVVLGGNASFGGITRLDIAAGASLAASSIIGDAAGQTIVNAGAIVGAVSLGDGSDSVDLSGRLTGTIDLGAGDDALILRASGTATAPAEGGSGTDALSINASTASDRAIGEGQFVNFETITLNADPGAQGRIVLAASSAALDRATLDAGVGSTSSVRLMQGELNLAEASASLRAPSIDVAASALLTGVGTVFTGMGNAQSGSLSVAGSISPGNAAGGIGTLHLFGAYRQTGSYVIDYRPPVDLNNIVGGALVGRNSYATPALAAGAQDADLLVINGAATLTGGSVLLRPQGSTAQFAAALTAPGNSRNEIRYQILHASGGLAGTRFVALSSANVALEYPNANDVDLVISGEVAPVLVVDGPPPTVTFNHVIGNALAQQLTASLPQSSFDCDVPIAGHGVPDRKLCLFGQISRNRVSLPIAGSGDASTTRYTPDALYTGFLRHVSTKLQLGFGIGHTGADQRGDGVQRSKVEGTALAFMTRLDVGRARLRATVGGGFYRATYNRESLFRDNRELTGAFDARFTNGTVEAELWFKAGKRLSFAPRIGGDWRVEWRDGFSEAGEALDRFSARAARIVRARATMGGIARLGFNLGSVPAFIEPSMFWTRELGDLTLPIEGIYAARPDIAVRTSAGNLPRNSFQANIGAAFQLSKQTTFRVQYENANRGGGHTESLSLRLSLAL
ncbi:MAG: autotransporter-associated beta strand repeat-containing protein [Sphingomonas sp.]|nr:autotransporter-associated beta strand repeat-containing protein [Sphingomonas sp.]